MKKYLRNFTFILAIPSLVFGALLLFAPTAHAVSGFDAGRIMDDSVFTRHNSMSASEIQSFLNSKVPNCDTNGDKPSEYGGGTRRNYAASRGVSPPFTCLKDYNQNGKSAARIIYDAAQEFRINPQVLLVLLQKEQGLITDEWPWPVQYRSATGYGCPDSAPCDSDYYGLTNQIRWAARMFRAIMDDSPTWYTPYVLGNNQIPWHPDTGRCGYSTVNIQNRATKALYNYTPYRPNQAALNAGYGLGDSCSSYGNRNFYLYFRDWFGSTYTSTPYAWELVGTGMYADANYTKRIKPPKDRDPTLTAGQEIYIRVRIRNMGYKAWSDSFLRIGTVDKRDRNSPMSNNSWVSPARPAAPLENRIEPGETAEFEFSMTAPSKPDSYIENFSIVAEGRSWLSSRDKLNYIINVTEPVAPRNSANRLSAGESLKVNKPLHSPDLNSLFYLRRDGKPAVRNDFNDSWVSGSSHPSPDRIEMQSDGNLVVRSKTNQAIWASGTNGNPNAQLVMQSDGNLVIYSSGGAPLWSTGTTRHPDGPIYVNKNIYKRNTMMVGQQLETPDRRYRLIFQYDGNLVLRTAENKPIWASNTAGRGAIFLKMQDDGNLVLRTSDNKAVWATGTNQRKGYRFTLRNDGNLMVYTSSSRSVWNSGTANRW